MNIDRGPGMAEPILKCMFNWMGHNVKKTQCAGQRQTVPGIALFEKDVFFCLLIQFISEKNI